MQVRAALRTKAMVGAAVALWVPLVAWGFSILWTYAVTPGRAANPPTVWPLNTPLARTSGRPTLVMFVHPECQCSRASLAELAILMAHAGRSLDAEVFFSLPAREAKIWADSSLIAQARAIPGVRVFGDRESVLAGRFGAYTSGQTLFYDAAGRLVFKGGITAFRGHSGDNAGRSILTALLQEHAAPPKNLPVVTPVFGCSLRGE